MRIVLANGIAFFIGIQWGIVGVATAYLAAVAALLYSSFSIPFKLIGLKVKALVSILAKPFVCSLTMFLFLVGLKFSLPMNVAHGAALLILIPAGISLYLLSSWYGNRDELLNLYKLMRGKPSQ